METNAFSLPQTDHLRGSHLYHMHDNPFGEEDKNSCCTLNRAHSQQNNPQTYCLLPQHVLLTILSYSFQI